MLTSAADYKYQSTGNYDVTRAPVYAIIPTPSDRPLYYSDMLYMSEALACISEVHSANSASSNLISAADNLPLTTLPLLSGIKSQYENSINNFTESNHPWLKPDAEFDTYRASITQPLIYDAQGFRAAHSLPALDAGTNWTADAAWDPLRLDKYIRAWSAASKMKRFLLDSTLQSTRAFVNGSAVMTDSYYSAETRQTSTTTSTFPAWWANGTYSSHPTAYGRDINRRTSVISFAPQSKLPYASLTINGVVVAATARSGDSAMGRYYDYIYSRRSLASGRLILSPSDATAYLATLGVDTSNHYYISIIPQYVDVTVNFRHAI